jgi:hypothetical protein
MSLQMNASAAVPSVPNQRKNRSSVLARRCWPIHSRLARGVDLVDEREELAPALPVDFVDADRANTGEIHVIPAPRHRHRDRPEHLIPAGAKDAGDLLPTEALGPRREKPQYVVVSWCFPSAHGTCSTRTPHRAQSTRRIA